MNHQLYRLYNIAKINIYRIVDITENQWIENCKADICIWPDVVEEQDKVLDSVRNNMVDECIRNRNPNEVTVEVSQNVVNLYWSIRFNRDISVVLINNKK